MKKLQSSRGFSLLELLISMALGLIVMASIVQLFKTALDSTHLVVKRAELQQNMRAGIEMLTKDISQAGSGIPLGGIQLPNGAGSKTSLFGCDQAGACHLVNHQYPTQGAKVNYMFGVIPGFSNGVEGGAAIPSAPAARNDSITVVYADFVFPLFEYDVTFPPTPTGSKVLLAVDPQYVASPPPTMTAVGGLRAGDVIWLHNSAGDAVGEVTNFDNVSITFADNDPLLLNQSTAANNKIVSLNPGGTMTAYRLFVVTYYLTVPVNGQLPRLMRQVNGLTPEPVADNVINLTFSYDLFNSTSNTLDPAQANPLATPGDDLNLTQKINISVLGQSLLNDGKNAQNMALVTSVSAQNMAFSNIYQPAP